VNANFARLCRRSGEYSLPWLVTIVSGAMTLRFINDVDDLTYNSHIYKASTFDYSPNPSDTGFSGGGSLQIAAADANEVGSLIALIESAVSISFTVNGILLDDGTVSEIRMFEHQHGTVRWDGRTASFTFETDDRLAMTFPALVFSHYNNRGN
jgi:hypothetical protein